MLNDSTLRSSACRSVRRASPDASAARTSAERRMHDDVTTATGRALRVHTTAGGARVRIAAEARKESVPLLRPEVVVVSEVHPLGRMFLRCPHELAKVLELRQFLRLVDVLQSGPPHALERLAHNVLHVRCRRPAHVHGRWMRLLCRDRVEQPAELLSSCSAADSLPKVAALRSAPLFRAHGGSAPAQFRATSHGSRRRKWLESETGRDAA